MVSFSCRNEGLAKFYLPLQGGGQVGDGFSYLALMIWSR
jgi:hypothetical protein